MTKEIFIVTVVTHCHCRGLILNETENARARINVYRYSVAKNNKLVFLLQVKEVSRTNFDSSNFLWIFFLSVKWRTILWELAWIIFKRLPESNLSGGFNGNCHNCPSTQFLIYNSVRVILHRWKLIRDYSIERSRKGFYVSAPVSLFNKCVKVLTSNKRYLFFPLKLF